ncbi:MAG: HAD family hydrolase [Lachnospiraceae bacterium]|nr:HAD family hydrolase [Lachnospiraceae bacterium]
MVEAIFIDFYGTVVFEDGENVAKISRIIYETGKAESVGEIGNYWWKRFKTLFENSYGEMFQTQRELETQSLKDTIDYFSSTADADKLSNEMFEYWVAPPIFEESKEFFERSPVPIYIVSNIDRNDILKAIEFHELKPAGVFTSEDARSYKPRKELFELALASTGLRPEQVVHIGDSLHSDIEGAGALGIRAFWINRGKKNVPEGVNSISNLLQLFDKV